MTDHWKIKNPLTIPHNFDTDNLKLEYELDIVGYARKLMDGLCEHEDAVGEKIVIDWLKMRGWRVERDD